MHPTARTWTEAPLPGDLPPGARATHLRALLAREGRFEHHLMVVARVGVAQLEAVCASEPLFFAHANVSDEWVLPLRTGDPLLDHAPLRVTDGLDLVKGERLYRHLFLRPTQRILAA